MSNMRPGAFPEPPSPHGYGAPRHTPWPPEAPARRSHTARNVTLVVAGVFVALVAIGAIGSALGGGGGGGTVTTGLPVTSSASAPADAAPAPKARPRIGQPARDGKFEFTVTGVKTVASVGDSLLGEKAQGVFVLVTVKVANIGDEARTFTGASQKLYDVAGRAFSANSAAAIYLRDAQSFLTDINPGNAVTGTVVFDVPKGTVLDRIELHDSMFSGGVEVSLR